MGEVMFAGYAIESLRMRLTVMPHLLLPLRQSSLRGTASILVNAMGLDIYPATRTATTNCRSFIRKIRHSGEPHPFALEIEKNLSIIP
jgi:hypothetical protein